MHFNITRRIKISTEFLLFAAIINITVIITINTTKLLSILLLLGVLILCRLQCKTFFNTKPHLGDRILLKDESSGIPCTQKQTRTSIV